MAKFQKHLTETDVASRLAFPIEWLTVLPQFDEGSHQIEFQAIDGYGFFWEFCCSIRRVGRYRKPVLQSEGWLKFVNHKGLKAGDKIVFNTEANDFRGTRFKIIAQKMNKEGDQWVDV